METKGYRIADEPSGGLNRFSVSPVILLLIALISPRTVQLLMPLAFLLNAWFMGAYNIKKQVITTVLGYVIIVGLLYVVGSIINIGVLPFEKEAVSPYIRILFNAVFFTLLYRLLLLQNPTFELINHIRGLRS